MVNGNYALYGDRPSTESAILDDHVHIRNDRKLKRKNHRTANDLQHSLNLVQLDNDTDSIKYEKKIMEPKLLRYVPTSEVEENFVTEQFETYDLKPAEERTRRYGFTKKPKNPADGSVNYGYSAYSRSSSACSSPNANLPTIAEHGEQYTSYNVHAVSSPTINDLIAGYDTKLDKYFSKPREVKPFAAKGTHPDSLYRVPAEGNTKTNRFSRVLRLLRWPVALIAVCIALAVFVYFLMPDNLQSGLSGNDTYWELPVAAGVGQRGSLQKKDRDSKPSEIDFYEAENDKNLDFSSMLNEESEPKNKPHIIIPPLFPTHLTPEVQYGNEKADLERRVPKFLEDTTLDDSTLIPHITQKPEKPLAIFFKEAIIDDTTAHAETITRAETVNDFINYDQKQADKQFEDYPVKTQPSAYKEYVAFKNSYTTTEQDLYKEDIDPESEYGFVAPDTFHRPRSNGGESNFTSGHSNFFGISIEEAEKMQSTTQSALYNTRVSPTLPTWRDKDDTTTKKYPSNILSDVQCRSTRLELCRGLLPYDLAGSAKQLGDVEITSYMSQIDYLVATNCSDRVRHFVCALLEPECSPPPHPTKMPCYNLCKSIVDSCDGHIPQELIPAFDCKQYHHNNCVGAKVPCYAREFTCDDSTCIPQDWVCDGRKDCAAGEDEQKCRQCDSNEYKCPTGGCIQTRWVCDGYKDCPSGEDESELKCGSQHVLALERNEPGEESSGSAPPAFVKRPNKYPDESFKEDDRQSENDNSKELLVTSHSSNPRTATRTYNPSPSPDRLRPYNHSSLQNRRKKLMKTEPVKSEIRNVEETEKPPRIMLENESYEPGKTDELGLFDDFERDVKYGDPRPALEPVKPISFMHTKRPDKQTERTPIRLALKNTDNKFDVVIDGAALMKKANDESKAEAAEMERMANMEKEDFSGDMKHGAHTSPCPSGELRCVDGHCITLAQLCDGTVDCSDHADEDNCYT